MPMPGKDNAVLKSYYGVWISSPNFSKRCCSDVSQVLPGGLHFAHYFSRELVDRVLLGGHHRLARLWV